jgi:hypothetical protein
MPPDEIPVASASGPGGTTPQSQDSAEDASNFIDPNAANWIPPYSYDDQPPLRWKWKLESKGHTRTNDGPRRCLNKS